MADFTLNVKADYKAMLRDMDNVQRRIAPAAAAAALNKTGATARTSATRTLAREKKVSPQRLVRDRLTLRKAHRNALTVTIALTKLTIPLIELGEPRQTRSGVRVKRHDVPGGFVATSPSGHRGVFRRTGAQKRLTRQGRYAGTGILREPIAENRIFLQPLAGEIILRELTGPKGRQSWSANLTRELKWRLEKLG